MGTGWNVMDALNKKTQSAAEDNKTKARFRTKDIAIKQLYSNDKISTPLQELNNLRQRSLQSG